MLRVSAGLQIQRSGAGFVIRHQTNRHETSDKMLATEGSSVFLRIKNSSGARGLEGIY
jgi:hypothetical protein